MTAPIAGWYPDPAGDTTKLRYWDGTKWTDSCMDASAATQTPQPGAQQAQPQPGAQQAQPQQPQAQPQQPQQAQPQTGTVYDAAYQQASATQPPQPTAAPPTPPTTPQPDYSQAYAYSENAPLYYVSPQDSTLRLIAFILALISTISCSFMIVTLAWMIPMTVMTWGIYKGKRPNTVAFGVCSLIFLNMVGGILLLVSTKDE